MIVEQMVNISGRRKIEKYERNREKEEYKNGIVCVVYLVNTSSAIA